MRQHYRKSKIPLFHELGYLESVGTNYSEKPLKGRWKLAENKQPRNSKVTRIYVLFSSEKHSFTAASHSQLLTTHSRTFLLYLLFTKEFNYTYLCHGSTSTKRVDLQDLRDWGHSVNSVNEVPHKHKPGLTIAQ